MNWEDVALALASSKLVEQLARRLRCGDPAPVRCAGGHISKAASVGDFLAIDAVVVDINSQGTPGCSELGFCHLTMRPCCEQRPETPPKISG